MNAARPETVLRVVFLNVADYFHPIVSPTRDDIVHEDARSQLETDAVSTFARSAYGLCVTSVYMNIMWCTGSDI